MNKILMPLALAFIAFHADSQVKPQPPTHDKGSAQVKPALSVNITKPIHQTLPIKTIANGTVGIWQEAVIGTETMGLRLIDLRIDVGDRVRAGDVLAVFASDTIRAELAQALAGLAEAEAILDEARQSGNRTNEQRAQARIEMARAQVKLQELRLAQCTLIAPDEGVISARMASVGSVPGAGSELFRLIRQGRIEWRAEFTVDELSRIQPGMRAQIDAPSGARVEGHVRLISPVMDTQTRNALVYVDLPAIGTNGSGGLKPGMFVRGSLDAGQNSVLTVPKSSVTFRDGFTYAYRLLSDQRVERIKVQTGRITKDRIEIVSGLTSNDSIVSSGVGFLSDGDLVRVVSPK
jgi:multidrug efflux pump subunit AcrA (membrane-fusion protein)